MKEKKTLEAASEKILALEAQEEERFVLLHARLARQNEMSEAERDRLAESVTREAEALEKASANLRKAQKWAYDQSDELKTRLKEGRSSETKRKILRRAPANSVIDLEEQQRENFAAGVNFYKIALICISGSFAGVAVETLWCLLRHGYIESRAGLVYGPFNLLYGVGAVALTLALYRYRNRSAAISFAGSMVIGSVVEYVLSWAQEMLFGSVSWDYSKVPFNINGRICLLYSVFWGILGVFWIKSIYPRVAKVILRIPDRIGKAVTWVLVVFLLFDGLMSLGAVWRWSERVKDEPAHSVVDQFFDDRFPDERMRKIYANMVFGDEK